MVRALMFLIAGSVCLTSGCAQPQEEEATVEPGITLEEAEAGANQIVAGWNAAMAAGDPEPIVSVYEESGVAMPPNSPAAEGQEAIRAWLAGLFADGPIPFEGRLEGFETAGDVVVSYGTYTMTFSVNDEPVTDTGKWIDISRRQPDGSLRTVRNIWNSDLPLGAD